MNEEKGLGRKLLSPIGLGVVGCLGTAGALMFGKETLDAIVILNEALYNPALVEPAKNMYNVAITNCVASLISSVFSTVCFGIAGKEFYDIEREEQNAVQKEKKPWLNLNKYEPKRE